jgi:hypothetical protein
MCLAVQGEHAWRQKMFSLLNSRLVNALSFRSNRIVCKQTPRQAQAREFLSEYGPAGTRSRLTLASLIGDYLGKWWHSKRTTFMQKSSLKQFHYKVAQPSMGEPVVIWPPVN